MTRYVGFVEDLLAEFDVRALKPDDERDLEADLLDRGDHALGDDVAAHDAAEDVDEDAFDLGVGGDDLERLGDLFGRGAAADVEEVGGLGAVELDDVHRRHREAGAVDHAADLAVERDVVEVEFGGFEFLGVLLGLVAQRHDVLLAVHRVAVEAHLGVEADQFAGLGDDQRVDLEHLAVALVEQAVEPVHEVDALLDLLALEPEGEGDAAAVEAGDAGGGIDGEAEDLLGRGGRDLLDVHAALGGDHEGDAAGGAVDEKGEVELAVDVGAVLDVDAVHDLAGRAGLVGDEGAAEHLLGLFRRLGDGLGDAHAALLTGGGLLERALAAAARVDLGLDHPDGAVEFAGGGFRLFGAEDGAAVGDRRAVFAQELLRLVLVNVHSPPSLPGRAKLRCLAGAT